MKKIRLPLMLASFAASALPTTASAWGEQWYGFYLTKGGLQMSVGPFDSKYACEAAKYNIPIGAKWMGCRS